LKPRNLHNYVLGTSPQSHGTSFFLSFRSRAQCARQQMNQRRAEVGRVQRGNARRWGGRPRGTKSWVISSKRAKFSCHARHVLRSPFTYASAQREKSGLCFALLIHKKRCSRFALIFAVNTGRRKSKQPTQNEFALNINAGFSALIFGSFQRRRLCQCCGERTHRVIRALRNRFVWPQVIVIARWGRLCTSAINVFDFFQSQHSEFRGSWFTTRNRLCVSSNGCSVLSTCWYMVHGDVISYVNHIWEQSTIFVCSDDCRRGMLALWGRYARTVPARDTLLVKKGTAVPTVQLVGVRDK